MHNQAAYSVCSPPPCGEGLGVGVVVVARVSFANSDPHPARLRYALRRATLPTRGRVGQSSLLELIPTSPEYAIAMISSQRRVGVVDAVRGFNHGALEARGLHREILGEEARDRSAPGGIGGVAGKPHRCKRFLG